MNTSTPNDDEQTDDILTNEELASIIALVEELDHLAPTPCGPYV